MARVDRRRAQREARHARASGTRRARGGSRTVSAQSVENQLFFTKLRSKAKWAFAVMVIVFGAGFAFLGVGSGGLDLGSLIRDTFGNKGSSGTSISGAQKNVAKHPREASAYKQLAQAYERKGQTDNAISAWQQYVQLKPKDATEIDHLANLQTTQAQSALQDAQAAYANQQIELGGSTFGVSQTKFGQALGQDPIEQAVSTKVTTATQAATSRYTSLSAAALASYKRLVKAKPDQDSYFALARAAQQFQDTKTALAAYRRLLKIVKDPTLRRGIKAQIKAIQPSAARSGG